MWIVHSWYVVKVNSNTPPAQTLVLDTTRILDEHRLKVECHSSEDKLASNSMQKTMEAA
jgi:hypothetical protein